MDVKRQAVSGIKWLSFSSLSRILIQVFRLIILARLLSPEDFGLMGILMIVIGLAEAYADLGINAAIIHRQDVTKEQLSSTYWFNILAGLAVYGLILLCNPLVVMLFKEPRLFSLLRVVALVFVISSFSNQFYVLLQKELNFDQIVKNEFVAGFIGFLVAVVLAFYGYGVWSLVFGTLAEVFCKTILGIWIGLVRYRPSFHFSWLDLKGFIRFGMFQIGERTVTFIRMRFDQIMIGSLLGVETLGFYNFAFNLVSQPVSRINPIVTRVAFPVFSKIQNDTERLRSGYLKVINYLSTINAPLLLGFAAIAPLAIPIVFGEKWSPGIILVQILSVVALSRSVGNPIGSLLLAKGRADLGFKWNLCVFLAITPVVYFGAKISNGTGVAVSLVILEVILYIPSYLWLLRPLIGECKRELVNSILKPFAYASLMSLIIYPIPWALKSFPELFTLSTQIGLGAVCYIFIILLTDRKKVSDFKELLFSKA